VNHRAAGEEKEGSGNLLFLEDAELAEAIDRSLRHAACHRCLMSLSPNTAHGLKDSLCVVLLYVELMAEAVEHSAPASDDVGHVMHSADVVRGELRRLDRALEVLLDPSMTEKAVPQTFDVKAICESLLLLVAARAAGQHVVITSRLDTGPVKMWGFPDQVHQALFGLLINALDAMPDGGTLQLALMKGQTIRVHVSDSGPERHPNPLSDERRSHPMSEVLTSGLEMYVTRSIVRAHGGTVFNQPSVSGGRCFIVNLPTGLPT
jgi:signal transduction histidine kinase